MTNRFGLKDGTAFILDCDKEENPTQARKDKLSFLLTLNLETLARDKRWNVEAVRALATCLVQTTKSGVRLAKNQLLDNLRTIQSAEREARKLEYAQLFERYNEPQELEQEVNNFMRLVADPGYTTDSLADLVLKRLSARYKTNKGLIKTGITDFKTLVRSHESANDRAEEVLKQLSQLTREANQEIKQQYTETVATRSADCIKVYPSYLLNHALTTLSNLPTEVTGGSKSYWKDVSIALAFATGRRMAEIHGLKTVFEVTGEYTVRFSGQVKTKGRGEVPPYEIPTLVPAKLVVAGWKYLKQREKLYETRLVNARVSKAVSTELPAHLEKLFKQSKIKIYKDLRAVYCLVLLPKKPDNMTASAWYSRLLGHGEFDLVTSNTYQTYYTDESIS